MVASHLAGQDAPNASVWERAAASFALWRQGDNGALDDLVRALTPVLWHTVRAYGLSQAAAEDVIQSTWLALVRNGHQVAQPAAVGGWLLTTARRTAWRAKGAERRAIPIEDEHLAHALPSTSGAEITAMAELSSSQLWQRVRELDDRCQRLLRIVAFDDRPDYANLAKDLGMPIGSIGPTRRRCLDKLRNSLQKGGQL